MATFGLTATSLPEGILVQSSPPALRNVPIELAATLEHILPVDPNPRRFHKPASPDGVLVRLSEFESYRNISQKAAIRAALTAPPGNTLLATLSTGTGKSLLFQLAALRAREISAADERPVVVVLVPTTALALDHEQSCKRIPGLENARALTSGTAERGVLAEKFRQGEIPLLFLSPEMSLGSFRSYLIEAALPPEDATRPLAAKARLHAIYVDEVHIVATWGRSFRPDLQRIPGLVRMLKNRNPDLRTVLLSATVDGETLAQLRTDYGKAVPTISKTWTEIAEGCPRREFDFVNWNFGSSPEREACVLDLARVLPRPAIIYTTKVEDAERIGKRLREVGFSRTAVFTGDTSGVERQSIISDWRDGRLDLVVGTSAFGLGVDQQEVRAVVHACLPENSSRYYQEIGRAGRDGHQAFAILLTAPEDKTTAVSHAVGSTLTLQKAVPRWKALLRTIKIAEGQSEAGVAYSVALSARGEQLANEYAGNLNRRWSKSLLIQLQRYGAICVESSDEDGERWSFGIKAGWESLLDPNESEQTIERAFGARDREESISKRDLASFVRIWGEDACHLQALFAQVEAGSVLVSLCGRCAACRRFGEVFSGRDEARIGDSLERNSRLRCTSRILLVESRDWGDPRRIVSHHAFSVVRQILAPLELVNRIARVWANDVDRSGWLVAWEEIFVADGRHLLLQAPAAVVLSPSGSFADRQWRFASEWHDRTGAVALWLANAGFVVDGRRLDDIASVLPPIALESERDSI